MQSTTSYVSMDASNKRSTITGALILAGLTIYGLICLIFICQFSGKEFKNDPTGPYIIGAVALNFIVVLMSAISVAHIYDLKKIPQSDYTKLVYYAFLTELCSITVGIIAFLFTCYYSPGESRVAKCYTFTTPLYIINLLHIHLMIFLWLVYLMFEFSRCCCSKKRSLTVNNNEAILDAQL